MTAEIFDSEQARINSVKARADQTDLKSGEKANEKLAKQLDQNSKIYNDKVNQVEQLLKQAQQLKNPDAKKALSQDQQRVLASLTQVLVSGENLLKNKEKQSEYLSIQSSTDSLNAYLNEISDLVAVFQQMEKAQSFLQKNITPKLEQVRKMTELKDKFDRTAFLNALSGTALMLGENGVGKYLIGLESMAGTSPEVKNVYQTLKSEVEAAMTEIADLKIRDIQNLSPEQIEKNPDLKSFLEVKNSQTGESYSSIGSFLEGARSAQKRAQAINSTNFFAMDPAQKKKLGFNNVDQPKLDVELETTHQQAKSGLETLEKVEKALKNIDQYKLPLELHPLFQSMVTRLSFYRQELNLILSTKPLDLATNHTEQLNYLKTEYLDHPEYQAQIITLEQDFQKFLNQKNTFSESSQAWLIEKNSQSALDQQIFYLKKLRSIQRTELPLDQQKDFDQFSAQIQRNIESVVAIQSQLAERSLASKKELAKFISLQYQLIDGKTEQKLVFTEAYNQASPEEKRAVQSLITGMHLALALNLNEKLELPEDKLWQQGKQKFAKNDLAGAKADLLAYHKAFSANPEKLLQVETARSLLIEIAKKELSAAMLTFTQAEKDYENLGGMDLDVSKDSLRVTYTVRYKVLMQVEDALATGKYLTLEEARATCPGFGGDTIKASDFETTSKIDFLDPFQQQQLLAEPNPILRRSNVLKLARAAKNAKMFGLSAKYYEMYFANRIQDKQTEISRDSIAKKFEQENGEEKVNKLVNDSKAQIRQNFIEKLNRKYGHEGATEERIKKWEIAFDASRPNFQKEVKDMMIDYVWQKEAQKSIHANLIPEAKNLGQQASLDALVWQEAYGGHFGHVDNITGSVEYIFTASVVNDLKYKIPLWAWEGFVITKLGALGGALGVISSARGLVFASSKIPWLQEAVRDGFFLTEQGAKYAVRGGIAGEAIASGLSGQVIFEGVDSLKDPAKVAMSIMVGGLIAKALSQKNFLSFAQQLETTSLKTAEGVGSSAVKDPHLVEGASSFDNLLSTIKSGSTTPKELAIGLGQKAGTTAKDIVMGDFKDTKIERAEYFTREMLQAITKKYLANKRWAINHQ